MGQRGWLDYRRVRVRARQCISRVRLRGVELRIAFPRMSSEIALFCLSHFHGYSHGGFLGACKAGVRHWMPCVFILMIWIYQER